MISNPGSRGNGKLLPKIESVVSSYPLILHRITESSDAIRGVLAEFASESIDVLAINGGDGTAAAVLGRLLSESPFAQPPKVVLLPGGTANMTAGDVGMRGNLLRAVRRLGEWTQGKHRNSKLLQRAVLRVQPGPEQAASYGMFMGAGIVMQGTEYAHREIHSRGLGDQLSLGLGLVRTVWGWLRHDPEFYQPTRLAYALDDAAPRAEQDTVLLLVSTLQRLFLGIRPYWGRESGALRLSLIRDHPAHFLRAFPAVLRGRPNRFVSPQAG
ncbi:MAG: diacylglycerol/lipid kinase family protein, partial [Pseudomonadales bacterium]